MRKQFMFFVFRWLMMSLGLWVASRLLSGSFIENEATTATFLLAGLVLSLVNSFLKPLVSVLSLPAILVTLGLFMLIINGLMVYLALKLVPGLDVRFWGAVLTGMIISVINYIITGIMDLEKAK